MKHGQTKYTVSTYKMSPEAIKAMLEDSTEKLYHLTSFKEKFSALHALWSPYLQIDFPTVHMVDHPSDLRRSRARVF